MPASRPVLNLVRRMSCRSSAWPASLNPSMWRSGRTGFERAPFFPAILILPCLIDARSRRARKRERKCFNRKTWPNARSWRSTCRRGRWWKRLSSGRGESCLFPSSTALRGWRRKRIVCENLARVAVEVAGNLRQKSLSKLCQFAFPHAADAGKLPRACRIIARHLAQGHVGENDVRRHRKLVSQDFAQLAQPLEEHLIAADF